jgi:uncharacterized protein YndB with AHSA1/START domain
MSDEAVRAKTGKTWKQWVRALDAVGAREMPHRDIARHVNDEYDVSSWWAQTITVGYERIRGLRDVGQRRGGDYDVNKSKTLPVPVAELYDAFSDPRQRERWLPGVTFDVRSHRPPKTLRVTWKDGTAVDIAFTDKGVSKSAVSIQHRKIPSKDEADVVRAFWTERLAALAALTASAP